MSLAAMPKEGRPGIEPSPIMTGDIILALSCAAFGFTVVALIVLGFG